MVLLVKVCYDKGYALHLRQPPSIPILAKFNIKELKFSPLVFRNQLYLPEIITGS